MASQVPLVRRLGIVLSASLIAAVSAGCSGTSVTQMTGPDPVRCEFTLSAWSTSVPAAASQVSVGVSTARDCTWSATSQVSWIQVAPSNGQGESSLTLQVAENTAQSTRSGTVSVADQQYQVNQAAAAPPPPPPPPPNCNYGLSPVNRTVGANGGLRDVRVITGANCPWTASSLADWITIEGGTSGTGTATIQYRVARNTATTPRIGTIVVAGQVHVVLQSGD